MSVGIGAAGGGRPCHSIISDHVPPESRVVAPGILNPDTAPTFLSHFYARPAVALVQNSVAPNERTLAGAVLRLIMNPIGLGLGPAWLGQRSEWLRPAHPWNSLPLACHTPVPFCLLSIALHWATARAIRREDAPQSGSRSCRPS